MIARIEGRVYGDTKFIGDAGRVPGVTVKHLGFGEFCAETPWGEVDFDRLRGVPFEGCSGRSHEVYGAGAAKLVEAVEAAEVRAA